MAVKPRLHHVAIWAAIPLLATAATFNLSSDITEFIPDCAAACFESFLEANFASNLCGTSPSLQCLCSKTGVSGFTIGEGAVQCIVAENNIGACTGMDAGSQIVANAYGMCIEQPNAAPLTHSTIIATLIVPTGTGPVLVPNPTSTSRVSSSVVTSSTKEYTTALITASPSISPSFIFATSTTSAAASTSSAAAAKPDSESQGLSTGQIAGIAAGGAAAVLLVIVAIYIMRCTYRKNLQYPDEKSSFSKLRDSWSPRRKSGQSPYIPQISAPRYHEPQSMDYSRPLPNPYPVRPETIGLAISPENGAAVPETKRSSRIMSWLPAFPMPGKQQPQQPQQQQPQVQPQTRQQQAPLPPPAFLLPPTKPDSPPKPSLTLSIPPDEEQGFGGGRLPARQPPPTQGLAVQRMPFNGGRDSVVTEFAEDGETDTQSNGGTQIWRPPSSDPQSATTYYVADKWGNWILSNPNRRSQAAELEAPIPLTRTLTGNSQQPMSSNMTGGPAQPSQAAIIARPPQVRLVPPERNELSRSRSSSVYSNYSLPNSVAPGPENPLPSRLPEPESYYKIMRDSSTSRAPRRKSDRRERSDTMFSHDSVTTIASSASGAMDGVDDFGGFPEPPLQGSLSPVVESPHSGGTSPVTYPKIPRPRSGSNKIGPGLRLFPPGVKHEYTPAGQPSPTLGLLAPATTGVSNVTLPPSQQGLPSQQQPQQQPQQQQQYPGPRRTGLNPFPNRNPGQVRNGSPNMPQDENNGAAPQPLTLGNNSALWPMQPGPAFGSEQQQQPLASPATSLNSNASSLLAKRLGAERAAALVMAEGGNGKKVPPGMWKRQQTPGTTGFLVDGNGPLPATPGWKPKLTPTRRGDDLFLSVQ